MMHGDIQHTDPKLLARLLAGQQDRDTWEVRDLAAMLRHQLAAPLLSDLEAAFPGSGQRVAALAASMAPPAVNFKGLLTHPSPSVELLVLVKDLAKLATDGPGPSLPHEIASYFYFVTIAVAWRRTGTRISSLSDERIQAGLAWLLQQPWVDEYPRKLVAALQERP